MRKVVKWIVQLILLVFILFLYARTIGTKGLKVKEYKVSTSKITTAYHGLKIVHISDIHYGSTVLAKQLEELIQKVNEIQPDIIVFTGDLFTENKSYDADIIISKLSLLEAKIGKFFVSGNHDTPIEEYRVIMEQSGFQNLDDTYQLIYKDSTPILLSGISSNYMDDSTLDLKVKEVDDYFASLPLESSVYSILLIHEPDFIDNLSLEHYDLILSGHSHLGQVRLPLIGKIITPYGSKKYYDAYYKINQTDLYISGGIGESIMNIRLFNHPSINFYRITKS